MVRGVDAGGIVDRIGVDPPAFAFGTAHARIFDAPQLRRAEIGAFAHDARADVAAVDA